MTNPATSNNLDKGDTIEAAYGKEHPGAAALSEVAQSQLSDAKRSRETQNQVSKLFQDRENILSQSAPEIRGMVEGLRSQLAVSHSPFDSEGWRQLIDQASPQLAQATRNISAALNHDWPDDEAVKKQAEVLNEKYYNPYGSLAQLADQHGARLIMLPSLEGFPTILVADTKSASARLPYVAQQIDLNECKEKLIPIFDNLAKLGKQADNLPPNLELVWGLNARVKHEPGGDKLALVVSSDEANMEIPVDLQKDVEPQLKAQLEKQELDIEHRYNVQIARSGQYIEQQTDEAKPYSMNGKMLQSRFPSFPETVALGRALALSYTSLPDKGQRPLQIAFLPEQSRVNGRLAAGRYNPYVNSGPLITIEQRQRDASDLADLARTEEVFVHELSHRAQDKLWGTVMTTPSDTTGKLNWEPAIMSTRVGNSQFSYGIRAKDGSDYCNDGQPYWWKKCIAIKDPEDKDGRLANIQVPDSEPISSAQLRQIAAVKPASDYFMNPIEEHAEALTNLRLGGFQRQRLLKGSPRALQHR